MDSSLFKNATTSRGVKYHYYYSPPTDSQPTLLFLHGFPCTSHDWRKQVLFFKEKGYGIIVPDLLGYGGTDKPADTASYKLSQMAQDLVDILNVEEAKNVIVVAHDWGSVLGSRLANYFQDRFLGFGYAAVGYMPPQPDFNIDAYLAYVKQIVGYETSGYWKFFASPHAAKLVEDHHDSFLSLVFTADPTLWVQHFGPTGGLEAWLRADKQTERAAYVTEEDLEYASLTLKNGYASAARWYNLFTEGYFAEDDKQVPPENYIVQKPVFFAGCKRDTVCLSPLAVAIIGQTCPNSTIHEFDSDHWLPIACPAEFNEKLLSWVQSISA